SPFLKTDAVTEDLVARLRTLNSIAGSRGQSLAQMALAWVLRGERVTSALVGASSPGQLEDSVAATRNLSFDAEELERIDAVAKQCRRARAAARADGTAGAGPRAGPPPSCSRGDVTRIRVNMPGDWPETHGDSVSVVNILRLRALHTARRRPHAQHASRAAGGAREPRSGGDTRARRIPVPRHGLRRLRRTPHRSTPGHLPGAHPRPRPVVAARPRLLDRRAPRPAAGGRTLTA